MSDQKPREWWIAPAQDNRSAIDVIATREPFGTHSSTYVHVIEKSAFDALKSEYANLCKFATDYELERDTLQAQVRALENAMDVAEARESKLVAERDAYIKDMTAAYRAALLDLKGET